MSLVHEFHVAFLLPAPPTPTVGDGEMLRLRMKLIREEVKEVMDEFRALLRPQTIPEQHAILGRLLKELCDLRYVTEGAAVSLGLPIEDAFEEVHRSNMSKLGEDGEPIFREDGKVLKGPGYREANMAQFVPPVLDVTSEDLPDAVA